MVFVLSTIGSSLGPNSIGSSLGPDWNLLRVELQYYFVSNKDVDAL